MIAALLPGAPARRRRVNRSKPLSREERAFVAGECILDGTRHGVTLLLYYEYLVARAGKVSSSIVTQSKLAEDNGVGVRTIRRYDDTLVAAGLIWLTKVGHSYRRTIVAYEPIPEDAEISVPTAEVSAVEPDPFFSPPPTGQIDPHEPDRSIPFAPFKEKSRDFQGEALRPGGETGPASKGFFDREDPGHSETMELLRAIGCYEATVRRLSHHAPGYVRDQIEAARRCGRAADLAAFVAFVLEHGGVYGSSWTGRANPRDKPASPDVAVPTQMHGTFDVTGTFDTIAGQCGTCGKWLYASDHDVCPYCSGGGP